MRRAQSLRSSNARTSVVSLSDDLGILREQSEESPEDALRKQLLTAERENDKLQAQILSLQDQLSQRPPLDQIQELEREYKNLELLLTGTQRENERCMAELERGKNREKMLERELTKLAGENWQTSLNIPASTTVSARSSLLRAGDATSFFLPQAESTSAVDSTFDESATPSFLNSPDMIRTDSPSTPRQTNSPANAQSLSAALAHIAQVRTLILGMEERMQVRENRLTQEVSRAESETRRNLQHTADLSAWDVTLGFSRNGRTEDGCKQRAAGLEFNTVSPLQDAVCEFSRSSYFLPRVVLSTAMHGDVGLGIDMAPPSRIARMTDVKGPCEPQKRLPKSGIATRGRNTVDEGNAHSQTLVAMRSSKGMTGLLLAEVGGSMVEMNKLGGGMGSNFREGKHIEPGAVTPVGISRIPPPSNSTQSSRAPSRLRTEHRRGMSLDQGLTRHGTLLSAQASPVRRAAELKVLLGDSSAKVKSGAVVSSQQTRSKKSPNAVAFEQGRSRVRVALNMDLENNVATEGGYISGTLLFCVRPKKKDDALSLGGGKIRVAGFEVAPGNEDRYIFYQVATPLAGISNGCDGLYTSAVDDEGFGSVGEGEYRVRFSLKLPLAGTGGKPRGILNSRSGATIKYIIIASMKVVDPATGKRSIAHFYRDCEIWPALDPVLTLAPATDPMLARAAKKVFMGGDGTVAVTASLHRCTWVAGQPVHVRLRISNDTRKTVRNVSLALMRTTTLFRPSARVSSFGDDMDASETATSEKRVAEAVLTAGQKGTKGHASAKGWWTGVGPGENRIIGHSITIPSDALTIPRSRLVEVDYAVRVSLGVSSIAGSSEAVHVTLPIRIVNFISLDPPPSGPVLPMQSSSVIELDTPRPESYSTSDSAVGMRMGESPSRVFLSPQYDSIGRSEMHGSFEREKMNAFSRVSFEMPVPSLPTAHTLHDLGGVEDAEDLNGMLGDIPGSVSILEEADITLDSGYSEGEFSAFSNGSSYIQDDFDPEGHGSAHSFDDGVDEDIGSDEELERVVGCASARIDGGAFQYSRTAYRAASLERKRMPSRGESYSSEERHAVRPGAILYEQPTDIPKAHRSGANHGIRGPRDRTTGHQHHVDVPQRQFVGHYGEEAVGLDVPKALPYERPGADTLYATRSMLQVSEASSHSLKESPSSMYSSAAHAATTSESLRTSPSKHMSSIPSKVSMQRLPRSRPPVSRALTAPANAVQISNTSDRGGVTLSSSATRAAMDVPAAKSGGVSSVRARIAMLEEKARDEEGSVNVRPDLVSRSLTTSAIPS